MSQRIRPPANRSPAPRTFWRDEVLFLLAVAAAAVVIFAFAMRLWDATWSIPLEYGLNGDRWCSFFLAKSLFDFGSVYSNPLLNFPHGYVGYDFPISEWIQLTMLRLCVIASGSSGAAINLFTLLNYPAAAVTAVVVMRAIGMRRGSALVMGLLFTCLPYHFYRQQLHLFLAVYFAVPLTVLMLWWLARCRPLTRSGSIVPNAQGWGVIGIAILCGLSGTYHVAFTLGLLFFAALLRLADRFHWQRLIAPAAAGAVVLAGFIATIIPTLQYQQQFGRNPATIIRDPEMADVYGLRLAEMLLPQIHHRFDFLGNLHRDYLVAFNQRTESGYATLGIVGDVGLVLLCFHGIRAMLRRPHDRRLALAGLFVLAAMAVASSGMLGSLFALWITPVIRSMNRISVFIAFFCLLAVGLRLDRWLQCRPVRKSAEQVILLAALLGVGLFDQTSDFWVPKYDQQRQQWRSDEELAQQIEQALGPDAPVFILPALPLPEGMVGTYSVGEPLIGYLHSQTLHWSVGFFPGREDAANITKILGNDVQGLPQRLRDSGFTGLLIDQRGFTDAAATHTLVAASERHFASSDSRFILIDLRLDGHAPATASPPG